MKIEEQEFCLQCEGSGLDIWTHKNKDIVCQRCQGSGAEPEDRPPLSVSLYRSRLWAMDWNN